MSNSKLNDLYQALSGLAVTHKHFNFIPMLEDVIDEFGKRHDQDLEEMSRQIENLKKENHELQVGAKTTDFQRLALENDRLKTVAETAKKNNWIEKDVSNEAFRIYHFPNDESIEIENPQTLFIEKHESGLDRHRLIIKSAEGEENGVYVRPGWLAISWQDQDGTHGIKF